MKNLRRMKESGITLIALVVTIIVLLILAGISINMAMGNNGLITKAKQASEENRGASVEEERDLWKLNNGVQEYDKNGITKRLDELLSELGPDGKKLLSNDEIDEITRTGQIRIASRIIKFKNPPISNYIKVGDYVEYNPALGVDDTSKLTYESIEGTLQRHGNGLKTQTFIAKPDIKWRVLNVLDETIEIIPKESLKKEEDDNSGYFMFGGPIGYLYAEQELNEISKIYGYGYGASSDMSVQFNIGGPLDPITEVTIENTGARSIKIEDINKIAKIGMQKDGTSITKTFTELDSSYGNNDNPSREVYYPTLDPNRGRPNGCSNSEGAKNLTYSYYEYNKDLISNSKIRELLFNDEYWLASRYIMPTNDTCVYYGIFNANKQKIGYSSRGWSGQVGAYGGGYGYAGIRPVITIKADAINMQNIEQNSGTENMPWQLTSF